MKFIVEVYKTLDMRKPEMSISFRFEWGMSQGRGYGPKEWICVIVGANNWKI